MKTYRTDPRPAGTAFKIALLNFENEPIPRFAPNGLLVQKNKNALLCTGCNKECHPSQFRYRSNGSRQSSVCLKCLNGSAAENVNEIPEEVRARLLTKLKENGISYNTYRQRLWHGWSPEKAMASRSN